MLHTCEFNIFIMQPYSLGQLSLLCAELLNQLYGEVIGEVGLYLLRRGNRTLKDIHSSTNLKLADV